MNKIIKSDDNMYEFIKDNEYPFKAGDKICVYEGFQGVVYHIDYYYYNKYDCKVYIGTNVSSGEYEFLNLHTMLYDNVGIYLIKDNNNTLPLTIPKTNLLLID